MSSRIRIIARIGGSVYTGGKALPSLLKLYMKSGYQETLSPGANNWQKVIQLIDQYPISDKAVMVLREPRKVKRENSRYKNILQRYGLPDNTIRATWRIADIAETAPTFRLRTAAVPRQASAPNPVIQQQAAEQTPMDRRMTMRTNPASIDLETIPTLQDRIFEAQRREAQARERVGQLQRVSEERGY